MSCENQKPVGSIRIYEAKNKKCRICKEQPGTMLPFCRDGDRTFFFLVCHGCRGKVPYEVIPVESKMDVGYFYCPEKPENFDPSKVVMRDQPSTEKKTVGALVMPESVDPKKPILTRYGRKLLLINQARESGIDTLTKEDKEFLRTWGVEFIVMKDGTQAHLRD